MESLSVLLVICGGNPPVTGGFPSKMVAITFMWCPCNVGEGRLRFDPLKKGLHSLSWDLTARPRQRWCLKFWHHVMKQWYALYVLLCSYHFKMSVTVRRQCSRVVWGEVVFLWPVPSWDFVRLINKTQLCLCKNSIIYFNSGNYRLKN